MKNYQADENRYEKMQYRRCGQSGIDLPLLSLGLWHNFGNNDDFKNATQILRSAFDHGITHFDLANNYGPPYGSAEKNFGKIFKNDFKSFRDELIISTKAGWDMWPGPYGNFGSRKYLISSLDQSLKRMKLNYVDIFYHHRPDPDTPLEETMGALDQIVRSGKALYVGISQYNAVDTKKAAAILKAQGTPFLIHQPRYSMLDRWVEDKLLDTLDQVGIGSIAFSPLEQGILTSKYLDGIPKGSRAAKEGSYLKAERITPELIEKIRALNEIAEHRGQSLAQMAIAWLLKDQRITSVLIGVSKVSQLKDNIDALNNLKFTAKELKSIETIIADVKL
ncbi:MAG TPA: L-glyceraldehyde 3-phosphate reductase, partial [Sphingobacteriaceae bacterium]|nr:L-glyceraldehyde 3-phosphate reductase [Sphingobacteriaceae bacterium]